MTPETVLAVIVVIVFVLTLRVIITRPRPVKTRVHPIIWIFWLIVFAPALIVVAIIHVGRRNRAQMAELLKKDV